MKKYIQIIASPAVQYVILRYATYGIQLLNTFLLLRFLGDYRYGIYSFIQLLLTYFSYSNLGLNQSVNLLLAIFKSRPRMFAHIWSVCCTINLCLSLAIIIINLVVIGVDPDIFSKYEYIKYAIWILGIGVLTNTNLIYASLYRIFGKLGKINLQQILPNVGVLIAIIFLREKINIYIILCILLGANLCSTFIFLHKSPLPVRLRYSKPIAKVLIKRGIHLMLQSFSFRFITVAATTCVGIFYLAEELGRYSMANTIVNAIGLALGAFSFVFYPKLLNRLFNGTKEDVNNLLGRIRGLYITGADYLSAMSLMLIAVANYFFPSYSDIFECFKILTISQIILNSSMGYSYLLVAKKQEHHMTFYGIISICIVLVFCVLTGYLDAPYFYLSFGTLAGIVFYSYMILRKGFRTMDEKHGPSKVLRTMLPVSKVVVIGITLFSFFTKENTFTPILAPLLLLVITWRQAGNVVKTALKILSDKKSLEI